MFIYPYTKLTQTRTRFRVRDFRIIYNSLNPARFRYELKNSRDMYEMNWTIWRMR